MSTQSQSTVYNGTDTGTTNVTPLTPSTNDGSTCRFQVVMASTGTIAWQHTVDGSNWVAIQATNEATAALATTATTSGIYTINGSGSFQVRPSISANGSGITITGSVVRGGGGGSSSGGSGGAVTIADGADAALGSKADAAIIDYTLSASEISLLKGILEVLQGTGAGAVVPTRPQDGAGNVQPAADTLGRALWALAAGSVADGSSGAAVPGVIIAGLDAGGLVRTAPVILGSSTPLTTAQYGIATYSMMAGTSSANTLRGIATGSNYTDGGSASTSLVVLETRATGAATHERVFNNRDVTWLASGARTTLQTLADATNQNYRGITVFVDVTAFTSTVTVIVNVKDPQSTKYFPIGTMTISGTGSYLLQIYPGAGTGSGNLTTINASLSRTFNITISGSATYSAAYSPMV